MDRNARYRERLSARNENEMVKSGELKERQMIVNYDAHGFTVAAKELPKACTACPFWLVEAEKFEEGECFLTGHIIKTDGSHDEKRMDDCPIIQRKKKRKAKRR